MVRSVILLAGPTFLHINTLAYPAGLTRSRRENQSMLESCWLGQRGHRFWDTGWSFTQDRFFLFKSALTYSFSRPPSPPPPSRAPVKKYSKVIKRLNQSIERTIAERGFDPRTSELWAQHASTAPLCYRRSKFRVPSYIKRSRHSLCKAGVDRKCQDSFNSFAPRLRKIVSKC